MSSKWEVVRLLEFPTVDERSKIVGQVKTTLQDTPILLLDIRRFKNGYPTRAGVCLTASEVQWLLNVLSRQKRGTLKIRYREIKVEQISEKVIITVQKSKLNFTTQIDELKISLDDVTFLVQQLPNVIKFMESKLVEINTPHDYLPAQKLSGCIKL